MAIVDVDRVAVYRFEIWDRTQRKNMTASHMATADTIRRLKGMADLSSKCIVARAALDNDGFYARTGVASE